MKKYKVILISGGFDPVHKGHIQCIQNAKKLADQARDRDWETTF